MTDAFREFVKDDHRSHETLRWFAERNIQLVISCADRYVEVLAFTQDKEVTGYAFDGDIYKALRATAKRWQEKSNEHKPSPEHKRRHIRSTDATGNKKRRGSPPDTQSQILD